jgi:hypothetical protein
VLGIIDGIVIDQVITLIIRLLSFLVTIGLYVGILNPLWTVNNAIKSKEKEK